MRLAADTPVLSADEPLLVIGLMSGTSADGVDAACCRLHRRGEKLQCEVLGTAFRPYPEEAAGLLRLPDQLSTERLARLHFEVAGWFAEAAREAARAAGVRLTDVALVGSHGQTVWHDPRGEIGGYPATLQIGESAVLAERTGLPVWADFRPADVAAGGEGAPFVPYADWLLFTDPGRTTVCLNLGGIANLTLLPPSAPSDRVIAFDTGPANMVLDILAGRLLDTGRDPGGERALAGQADPARVERALADSYFSRAAPKSTGRERFGTSWVERHFGPLEGLSAEEASERLASAATVTVESVVRAIEGGCATPRIPDDARVVVSGGGRKNRALMNGLVRELAPREVVSVDELGWDGDFKEAVAFAVLAYESALGRPVNLPSATGARHPARCGKLAFPPPNAVAEDGRCP